MDAAAFATTGHIDGIDADVGVRRAFFNTEGDIALRWPIHYRFEAGLRSEEPYLNALWFEHRRPSGVGVTVGQLDAPLSRERLTSSNAITFLERASPVRAFAPGTKAGVQLSYGADDAAFAASTRGLRRRASSGRRPHHQRRAPADRPAHLGAAAAHRPG